MQTGPSLHAVGLQLLGLVLHKGGGGSRRVAGGDGRLDRARVAISYEPGGGGGSVGVLIVGSCGVLGIGLAGGGVVDVGRCDGLHRGRDHHAGLDDRLGVNVVRRESGEAKAEESAKSWAPSTLHVPLLRPQIHVHQPWTWCCPAVLPSNEGCCFGWGR